MLEFVMTNPSEHPKAWRSWMYRHQAAQYYISGRHATLCGFVPVASMLFHHAFEMVIKARILDANLDLSDKEATDLLKGTYGHKLKKLWSAFLKLHPDEKLKVLTPQVEGLDGFEDVRYPPFDAPVIISAFFDHEEGPAATLNAPNAVVLFVCLEDMDVLMSRIWTACGYDVELLRGWNISDNGIKGQKSSPFVEVAYYCNNRHSLYKPAYEAYFKPFDDSDMPGPNAPSKWNP
jgi:hypothetical protein